MPIPDVIHNRQPVHRLHPGSTRRRTPLNRLTADSNRSASGEPWSPVAEFRLPHPACAPAPSGGAGARCAIAATHFGLEGRDHRARQPPGPQLPRRHRRRALRAQTGESRVLRGRAARAECGAAPRSPGQASASPRSSARPAATSSSASTCAAVALLARVLRYLDGEPLTGVGRPSREQLRTLGTLSGRVAGGLVRAPAPGLDRTTQWDARISGEVRRTSSSSTSRSRRNAASVREATEAALARLEPLRERLRVQAVHGDVTDDNIVLGERRPRRSSTSAMSPTAGSSPSWRPPSRVRCTTSPTNPSPCWRWWMRSTPKPRSTTPTSPPSGRSSSCAARCSWSAASSRSLWRRTTSTRTRTEPTSGSPSTSPGDWMRTSWRRPIRARLGGPGRRGARLDLARARPSRLGPRTPSHLTDLSVLARELDAGAWLDPDAEDAMLARTSVSRDTRSPGTGRPA